MKAFRYLAALLAALTVLLSLTACAKPEVPDNGTVTLTVYDQSSSLSGDMNGWFADVLREKFNIKLQFRAVYDAGFDAYVEQGILGDIMVFDNESDYRTARDAGLLLNWDDYGLLKDYGGFLSENYPEALDKNRSINPDGGLYGIYGNVCRTSGHDEFYNCFYIRWDLYSRLGYPEINTLEDFEALLSDMAELASADSEAEIYGISAFGSWDDTMLDLARATAGLYGYEQFGFGLYNPATGSYEPCIDEDGIYIRCLKFYNSLYRAGLLDPSSEMQTYAMAQKDYGSGRAVLGMYKYITDPYNTTARLSQGKRMLPIAAGDFKNITDEYSSSGRGTIWSVSSKCVYPERCLELISWLYSPEGILTNLYGPRDVTWGYDSSGLPYITEFGYACLTDMGTAMPEGFSGAYNTGFSMFGSMTVSDDSPIDGLPDGGQGGDGDESLTYSLLTWRSVQSSRWYQDTYGKYDEALYDWREHTGASDLNEYIEKNGFTLSPAGDFVCDELPSDLFLTRSEISGDICTNSWLAIYASSSEEFDAAIKAMQTACTSRDTYDELMNFYDRMLQKYKESTAR